MAITFEQPKYPVGKSFLKNFQGYGVWEGRISSFDGDSYTVVYPEDGYEEAFDCSSMDRVVAKSDKLIERKVRVANRETGHKPSAETTTSNNVGSNPFQFQKGQHVWVVMGREKHPAVIHFITNDAADGNLPTMVRIKWSMTGAFEDVASASLLPMFEDENGETVTSVHSKRNRTQTNTYAPPTHFFKSAAVDGEPVRYKKEVKEEESPRGVMAKKMSKVGVVGSNDMAPNKSQDNYRHEGFQFTRYNMCLGETEDIYWCSYRRSANCPVKLKLNRETGETVIVRTYTTNNEPVEHTKECKYQNGKVRDPTNPLEMPKIDPEEVATGRWTSESKERAAKFLKQQHTGRRTKSTSKRDAAMRGWERRRNNDAFSTSNNGKLKLSKQEEDEDDKQEEDEDDKQEEDCTHQFTEGQHVWVSSGKARHPAVIDTIGPPNSTFARVRWSTMNTFNEVAVNQILPMFEEKNGEPVSSSFSKRERKQVDRFSPPPLKSVKVQETIESHAYSGGGEASKIPAVAVARKRVKEDDSDFIRENIDTTRRVPPGLAPGPGWASVLKGKGRQSSRRWISPREEIMFKFPRLAFEFEEIRQQCNGDEGQAFDLYLKKRLAAGKKPYIMNRGRLARATKKKMPTHERARAMRPNSNTKLEEETPERASSMRPNPSTKMEEDIEPLDQNDSTTIAEIENDYKSLWDYYLKPSIRENEELLGSGMILRRRKVLPNLLRFKNSVFRQKLYRRIVRLESLGRKYEIHRILKELKKFDSGMQSGDGPCQLLDEILGPRTGGGDVEVLDASAVSAMRDRKENCDNLAEPSSPGGLAERNGTGEIKGKKSTGVVDDPEQQMNASMPAKIENPLADRGDISQKEVTSPRHDDNRDESSLNETSATNFNSKMAAKSVDAHKIEVGIRKSPPEMHQNQEFFDLCGDSDIGQVPNIKPSELDCAAESKKSNDFEVSHKEETPPPHEHEENCDDRSPEMATKTIDAQKVDQQKEVIDLCEDDAVYQVSTPTIKPSELDQMPSHQQQASAIHNVLQESIGEETSTSSSITKGDVNRSANDHEEMPEDGTPSDISSNEGNQNLVQQPDCIDLTQDFEAENNQAKQPEVIDLSQEENLSVARNNTFHQAMTANEVIILD
mmetsp:Transcript_4895/g.11183  ORF Transcript_4895/g.11183 Transcript_4895/m.11183 type:complete len:1130 (+) Transcript_4895:246-3635(+)|eukprot:CAMPEP_0172320728 /NCGR_PEP_ID=MMETSP1058-20130122/41259_1 /TAXON_ID=83371 /ORGANISM="Detonula confervacea, Strain CCMP 353" /LENGTH=1129 /DNA_ID=CAMNT_0013036055 /DNA_START=250 /DNA_END=3639 /DNA_ORIENTATION=-